jgi:hypothetical protein
MHIVLRQHARGNMMGMRSTATPLRRRMESALKSGEEVCVDFSGVEVTQSVADELLGALILLHGPQIMRRIVLKGCSTTTQEIVRFVARDRAHQRAEKSRSMSSFGAFAPA